MRRQRRPATVPLLTAPPPATTSLSRACSTPWSSQTSSLASPSTLFLTVHRAAGRLYTDPRHPGNPADGSNVFEGQRFGKPRVAHWNERLPSHQPACRRHEAAADGEERGHVQGRRTEPLRMERRHDLPV